MRSHDRMVFTSELELSHPGLVIPAESARGGRVSPAEVVAGVPRNGVLYVCGPMELLRDVRQAWQQEGRPPADLRFETFGASGNHAARPYQVTVPRHGVTVEVPVGPACWTPRRRRVSRSCTTVCAANAGCAASGYWRPTGLSTTVTCSCPSDRGPKAVRCAPACPGSPGPESPSTAESLTGAVRTTAQGTSSSWGHTVSIKWTGPHPGRRRGTWGVRRHRAE